MRAGPVPEAKPGRNCNTKRVFPRVFGLFLTANPITLDPGDIVVLLTDGLQEAMSPAHEQFGRDRVLEVVRAHRTRKAAQIVESLYLAVCDFSQREKPADDVTAIVIKVEDHVHGEKAAFES